MEEFDKYLKGKEVDHVECLYENGNEYYIVNFTDKNTKLKIEVGESGGFFIGVEKDGKIMFGTGFDVIYEKEQVDS